MKTMKTMKIRHYDYMSNDLKIKEVKVKRMFEAGGRNFAVCATHEKVKFCDVFDVLTGAKVPGQIYGYEDTVKGKVDAVSAFMEKHAKGVNWDKLEIINAV